MFPYPTWLEIDLSAVEANTRQVLAHSGTALMAVVKADAYGFGAVEIARSALSAGASWLAVARCSEAITLRHAGITAPILLFGALIPAEVDTAIALNVTLTLADHSSAEMVSRRAQEVGKPAIVHLEVDTGMGRFGIMAEEAVQLARQAQMTGMLRLDGIYTHFSTADSTPQDPFLSVQLNRFQDVLEGLQSAGITLQWIHAANSAAALGYPQARFNMVRVGSALLGIPPYYFPPYPAYLRHVLKWKARLVSVRRLPSGWGVGYGQTYRTQDEEWIGVVPVGYADGFRRSEGNEVLIDGGRVPVVGRVCSDQCMVRLPGELPLGSEVVLIGEQGTEAIYIEDLANRWGISYANVTSPIHARVPRVYLRD